MHKNSAIVVQCRAVCALMLFEIRTLYGDARLGYLWALVKTAFGVVSLLILRIISHAKAPHGLSSIAFLLLGFMIWQIFSQTVTKTMNSVRNNRNFLAFPQIFPLDIIIARTLVIIATEVVCAGILFAIFSLLGLMKDFHIANILLMLASIFGSACFGVSCGTICLALSRYFPAVFQIVPLVLRIFFFASGIFFSVASFSHKFGTWLLYNPVMQFVEMSRHAVAYSYPIYYDFEYLAMLLLPLLTIGLLFERYIRRYELQ